MGYKQDLKNEPFNVCVIAYPGTAQQHSRAGKSCLINRFMSQESYCDDHLSVLSLAEFDSEVVGGTHWLYWGERNIHRDEGRVSRLRIIEHCEFLDDCLFAPIRASQTYLERCLARNITVSSRKLAYICKDQIGRETAYPKHYLDKGTYLVSVFVYVYDITLCGESASNQACFLRSVLKNLIDDNIPLVLVTSKHDVGSSETARSLLGMVLGQANKRWIQRMLFLVETSAKLNVNITTAFLCALVFASHGIILKKRGEGHSAISRLNQRIRMFSLQSKKESRLKLHFHEYTPSTLVYGTPSCLLTSYEIPEHLPRSLKKDRTVANELSQSAVTLFNSNAVSQLSLGQRSSSAHPIVASTCPAPLPTPPPLLLAALAKHPSHLDLGTASIPSAFFANSHSSTVTISPQNQDMPSSSSLAQSPRISKLLRICIVGSCQELVTIVTASFRTVCPLNLCNCSKLVTKSAFSVPPEGCMRNASSASVFNSLPEAGSSQHACLQQAFRIFVYNRIDQLNGTVGTVNLLLLWLDLSEVSRENDNVAAVSSGFALTSKLKIPLVSASSVHTLQVIRVLLDCEDARSRALSHTDQNSSNGSAYPTATFMDWPACPTSAMGLAACLSTSESRSDVLVAVALVRVGQVQATQLPPNSSRTASDDEQNNEPFRLVVRSVPPASGTARTLVEVDSSDPCSPSFVFLVRDQLHELLGKQTLVDLPSLDSYGCVTVIHFLATVWPDIREPVDKCLSEFACKSAGQQRWTEARLNCSSLVFVSLHADQTGYQASAEFAQQAKEDLSNLAQANGYPFFVLHSGSHGGGGADVLWQLFPSSADARKFNGCTTHPQCGVCPDEGEEGMKGGWIGFISLPTWDCQLTAAHRRLLTGDPRLTRRASVGCDITNGQVTPGCDHLGSKPAPPGGVRSCQKISRSFGPVPGPGTTTTVVSSDQRPVVVAPHGKESFSPTYLARTTNLLMSQCPPGVGNTENFPIVRTDNGIPRNRITVSPCHCRDRTRASSVAVPSESPAALGATKSLCGCSHLGVGKPESVDEEYYSELPIANQQSLGAGLLTTQSAGRHTRPKRPQLHSLSSSSSCSSSPLPSSTCSSVGQGEVEVGGDPSLRQALSQSHRVLMGSSSEEGGGGGQSALAFKPTATDRVSESGASVYAEVDDSLVSNASTGPTQDNGVPLPLVACPYASQLARVGLHLHVQQDCTRHLLGIAQCPGWLSVDGHLASASLNGQLPYRFSPRGCVLPPLPVQAPPPPSSSSSSLVHCSTTTSSSSSRRRRRRRSADVMCCPAACDCSQRQQQLAWCKPSAISSLLRYVPSRPVVGAGGGGAGETRPFGDPSRCANNCMEPVLSAHRRPLPSHSGGTGSSALETIGNALRRQGAWFRNSFLTRRNRRQS